MDVDSRCFSSSCWTSFAFIHPFIHGSDFKWCYLWWKFDRWLLFMYINRLVASVYFYWYVQKLPLMLRKFINIWLYTTNINWLTRTQKINASPPTGNEQKKKMAKGSDGLFVYLYVWRNGPASGSPIAIVVVINVWFLTVFARPYWRISVRFGPLITIRFRQSLIFI